MRAKHMSYTSSYTTSVRLRRDEKELSFSVEDVMVCRLSYNVISSSWLCLVARSSASLSNPTGGARGLGAKTCIIDLYSLPQVSRISAAFSLQPPIYLVRDYDNSVLFPVEGSGKFLASSLSTGALYEVHGVEPGAAAAVQESTPSRLQLQSPYGAYPYQFVSQSHQTSLATLPHPPSHPPQSKKGQ